ncbi:tripartite tricarboxylate transporter substrate binding protein, partial [Klebsiella pneumoniae]
AGGLAALLALAAPVAAQEIKGPVKLIVGYPPGGSTDALARLLADRMKDPLNTAVTVENRPGAGGRAAAEQFKTAPADGSVLMVGNVAVAVIAP